MTQFCGRKWHTYGTDPWGEDAMLDIANDIRSLSDFKRDTAELLERLKKTGNILVLTIN